MKVNHVFFDAAGTLFRVRGSVGEVYGRCAERFGLKVSPEEINLAFLAAFRNKKPMTFPGSKEELIPTLEREWWKEVVEQTFRQWGPFPQMEAFFETLYEAFRTRQGWVLEPGCEDLLERLRGEGKRLGIISNFDSRLTDVMKDLGVFGFFDTITISSRSPSAKPDPLIFARALEQAGSEAKFSLHIGNDPRDDFWAARRAGLKALLYDPQDRYRQMIPEFRIRKLPEVISFLL